MKTISSQSVNTVEGKKRDKPVSITQLKKIVWPLFSRYIRLRDCLITTGHSDMGRCITCGKIYSFKKLQAGHFIQGRHNNNLFDERGVHIQCYYCNIQMKGYARRYEKFMRLNYGEEVIADLDAKNEIVTGYSLEYLLNLRTELKAKILQLETNPGVINRPPYLQPF